MPPETAEQTKDRIKAGWATFGCIYVAGVVLVVLFIAQEVVDLFERVCPACFGR